MWQDIWSRVEPVGAPKVDATLVLIAIAVAAATVFLTPIWQLFRIVVTIVHELGHAVVGMAAGRRFTGLVLRPDMSGETITSGRTGGVGLILSTWVGYPAPAVVGTALVFAAERGWAAPTITGVGVLLLGTLVMVRSVYTAGVMLLSLITVAALWWWQIPDVQFVLTFAAGLVLLLGAWRHIGAVATKQARRGSSDPGSLARLTHVPAMLWVGSFGVVALAGTAVVGFELWQLLGRT